MATEIPNTGRGTAAISPTAFVSKSVERSRPMVEFMRHASRSMTDCVRACVGRNHCVVVLTLALGLANPRSGAAQESVSDVLTFLITSQSVQTGNVDRDQAAALATGETISRALLANLATLPVSTSSGPFVYRLNPELGTVERATRSF